MQFLFVVALGSMIIFNGALIVYFLGNAYIIPQFLPQFHSLGFGHSLVFVILGLFLFITLFGNRVRTKRKVTPLKKKGVTIPTPTEALPK